MIAGIIIGLMASLHCIGMCGPIALALPLDRSSNTTKWWGLMQYGIGKTVAYASLGVAIGFIGAGIQLLNALQIVSIVLGVLTIVYGLLRVFNIQLKAGKARFSGGINHLMVQLFKTKSPFRLTLIGFANGLLPCGMVILALTNALLIGSPSQSILAMIGFGLGTLPILFAVNLVGNYFPAKFKAQLAPMIPYYIVLVGVFIIIRGLDLGIPYVSPKSNVQQQTTSKTAGDQQYVVKQPTIGYSCCSKPSADSLMVK